MYNCTGPETRRSCIDAKWHLGSKLDTIKNYEVLMYFSKFTIGKKLKKPVRDALQEREDLEWEEVPQE